MLSENMIKILDKCTQRVGATDLEIASLEMWVGRQLPKSYLDLLRRTNGIEGFVSDDAYLILWSSEQVAGLNEAYSVAEFAPGLLLIGTDGSNTGYALDLRRSSSSMKQVPLVGMSLDEAKDVGTDFEDFLRRLASIGH
jgi:hypothetical protein